MKKVTTKSKFVQLPYLILWAKKAFILVIVFGFLTGCSTFGKENKNDLKESPCACMEMNTTQG